MIVFRRQGRGATGPRKQSTRCSASACQLRVAPGMLGIGTVAPRTRQRRLRRGSAIPTRWPVCVWRRVGSTSIVDTEGFE